MTCIVALEHKGKIYMGGDSAAVNGLDIYPTDRPKVFRVHDFLIGYTTSFRMGQLLEYNLVFPERADENDLSYLIKKFIPAVRECLKNGGFTTVNNNEEIGGNFLVGYGGKIYQVSSDFQVLRSSFGFAACGCGASFAIGALEAMDKSDPKQAIRCALKVAGMFSAGVCAPYYVLQI